MAKHRPRKALRTNNPPLTARPKPTKQHGTNRPGPVVDDVRRRTRHFEDSGDIKRLDKQPAAAGFLQAKPGHPHHHHHPHKHHANQPDDGVRKHPGRRNRRRKKKHPGLIGAAVNENDDSDMDGDATLPDAAAAPVTPPCPRCAATLARTQALCSTLASTLQNWRFGSIDAALQPTAQKQYQQQQCVGDEMEWQREQVVYVIPADHRRKTDGEMALEMARLGGFLLPGGLPADDGGGFDVRKVRMSLGEFGGSALDGTVVGWGETPDEDEDVVGLGVGGEHLTTGDD